MAMVRWDVNDLSQFEDRVNRLFGDWYSRRDENVRPRGAWVPPVDIIETADSLVLKAELPEVNRDEIELTVDNHVLTLRGSRKLDDEFQDRQVHRVERSYGEFSRSFTLPSTVDTTRIAADYKDGVLRVTLPLRAEAKPKQIPVNPAS